MATSLRASSFPFCALVAPAPGDSIAVLQQLEGPVSPAELVEILQRTMEEQGLAFGSGRAREQEQLRADHRLREEQVVAYIASLQIDEEKEKLKNIMPSQRNSIQEHVPNTKTNQEKPKQNPTQIQPSKQKEATSAIATMQNPSLSQSSKKKESIFAKATMQNPTQSHSSKDVRTYQCKCREKWSNDSDCNSISKW